MSTHPTAADAEVIIKLYDLRREAEMRKARNWWLVTFWPETADDFLKIGMALGTQENNWEMCAGMVLHGAVNEDLFMEPSFCGEMFFIFAKVRPFLNELREKFQSPSMFSNIEKLINKSEKGRETLKVFETRIANRRKTMAEAARAKAS